jgi:hypothetical protein
MADLSPHSIFSSPWIHQSDLPSPPPTKGKEISYGSLFSPSFFSPFNKSLNPLKFNVDLDDQDSVILIAESFESELYNPLPLTSITNSRSGPHPEAGMSTVVSALEMENNTSVNQNVNHPQDRRGQIPKKCIRSALPLPQAIRGPQPPLILPKETSIVPSNPPPNLPFTSPSVIAKAKQSTMSPEMSRGHCNCKKSRCLKLSVHNNFLGLISCLRYCECFAALRYCSSCHCVECNNSTEFESVCVPLSLTWVLNL